MPAITHPAKLQQENLTFWIIRLCILGAIILGALHAWAAAASYSMNSDGISYLDIGDAYWRGDWETAINPVWSPLYPWILGGLIRLFHPDMRLEFPLIHAVNFIVYLMALLSFSYFWKQAHEYHQFHIEKVDAGTRISIPDWAFYAFGYLIFIWSSLTLIEIWAVTPDMLMAMIIYLTAGILLRMRIHFQGWLTFALLGFLLGVSYLTKSIMMPVSFLFLGATLFTSGGFRRLLPRVIVAIVVFLLIVSPYVTLISFKKGYFTFGESGKITYLRHINRVPFPHLREGQDYSSTPLHPSRLIFSNPPIYEFGTPIGGTYPISYDPSYWYEGINPDYRLSEILPGIISNLLVYFDLFINKLGIVMGGILILYLVTKRRIQSPAETINNWSLTIISIIILLFYSLVYVEGRYIAVFIVLILADLLSNLTLPNEIEFKRISVNISMIIILSLLLNLAASNLEGYSRLVSRSSKGETTQSAALPSWPGEVVEELMYLGIDQGDQVAVIGYAYDSYWARLARVRIVAEMLDIDANPFWYGNDELQTKVITAFQSTGAKAIVAEEVPKQALLSTWHQVGNTNVYIYLFDG